ncbi:uncharacterized protein BDV17DRAFT_245293 [Aspergillus undulatus]|uniref:uncharacterized protein n=1 Tax=Aspergillus undulatus TaxID=1810928 RepID=UPI003CCDB5BB
MPRPSASGAKPEKNAGMSSRLLTMKFMQRAAASAASKENAQPTSASESKESTPKKRRVSGVDDSPTTPSSDLEAISAALAQEEEKRRYAISRQAAEAGETEWVLDFGGADAVGQYAQQPLVLADSSLDADDDDLGLGGRQVYGNFKKKNKSKQPSEGAENESNADAEAANQKQRNKKPNLDEMTSISNSGRGGLSRPGGFGKEKSQKKRKHNK